MSIVENRKAFHDYFVEERFEAGISLQGWEAKAIRAGRVQLAEAYVVLRNGGLNLVGCHISPLLSASTHVQPDPTRTRKLLMHAEELRRLIGKVERAGYTLIPLNLHYKGGWIKLEIASVAAASALLPKPSASTARRGNSPINATLPGPAMRYCQVIRPLREKSCQPSLAPT